MTGPETGTIRYLPNPRPARRKETGFPVVYGSIVLSATAELDGGAMPDP